MDVAESGKLVAMICPAGYTKRMSLMVWAFGSPREQIYEMQTESDIVLQIVEEHNRRRVARANRRATEAEQRELEQARWLASANLAGIDGTAMTATGISSAAELVNGNSIAQRIVNGTATTAFKSVGMVGNRNGFSCSGTLIASRYVLTAGHCGYGVGDTAGRFKVEGQTYYTSRVFVHPNYNRFTLANDIAIYELNRDVVGVAPSPIFRGTPRVGQTLTLVGFGAGGNGTSGHNGDFGTKRVGTTPIDKVTTKTIEWNFDNNSESNTAPGDSGGPAFLKVDGVYRIAGVTSAGEQDNAGIGDVSYDTRVDAFQTWIDSILKGGTVGGPTDDHADQTNNTATPIAANGEEKGKLEFKGDRDVFRVDFARAGTAVFKSTASGSLDTYLRVYNSAGKLVGQNDDFGSGLNSLVRLPVKAARYYLSVGSYRDAGTGGYVASVRQTTIADDYPRGFTSAHRVQFNDENWQRVSGSIETGTDVDMFKVVATESGRMRAVVRRRTGNLDSIVSVFNAQQVKLGTNSSFREPYDAKFAFDAVKGKTYFVRIESTGSTTGDYALRLALNTASAFTSLANSRTAPLESARNDFLSLPTSYPAATSQTDQRLLRAVPLDGGLIDSQRSTLQAANPFASSVLRLGRQIGNQG